MSALKYDSNKPRMELLPAISLTKIAEVLTYGAAKYTTESSTGDHNWRKGMAWSRLYGAAMRHLTAHMDGDSVDKESGISHLAHAACCILFLIEYEAKQYGADDRWKSGKTTKLDEGRLADGSIITFGEK